VSGHGRSKQLSQSNLERVLKREELLLVLFVDNDPTENLLASQLKVTLAELETVRYKCYIKVD